MSQDLIYICNNNGSDTRIAKEIDTLSRFFLVHFLGFEKAGHHSQNPERFASYNLVKGKIRSPRSVFSLFSKVRGLLSRYPHATIHVVNEQLAILLMPLLIRRHVVIDSFDSMFLRMNLPGNRGLMLKRFVYGSAKAIIVTDLNRFNLLPDIAKSKSIIIPNVPRIFKYPEKSIDQEYLTLCYFGSLAEQRGSRFVSGMLDANPNVRCIAAGWIADDYTEKLISHDRIEFMGSLPQEKVNSILAEKGDYLVAIYPLNNQNNINASPNKIFDSIHTRTPIIITKGVKVSDEVVASGTGVAVDTEKSLDFRSLGIDLLDRRRDFYFSDEAIRKNSWEAFEEKLCAIHRLSPGNQR